MDSILYPNLFVVFVGPPGTGKSQAINEGKKFWTATGDLNVAPASLTAKGLIDHMAEAKPKNAIVNGQLVESRSLLLGVPELGVLLSAHDLGMLSILNALYDCDDVYEERSRTSKKVLHIPAPMVGIMAGTQPDFLASILPEEAFGMGFISRVIMVYSSEIPQGELFGTTAKDPKLRANLQSHLKKVTALRGEVKWHPDTQVEITAWDKAGKPPIPIHHRLISYNSRRLINCIKLSVTMMAATRADMVIMPEDFFDARALLLEAEDRMPDIFAEMRYESNEAQIQEAWNYMLRKSNDNKGKPVHESELTRFLSRKVLSYQVEGVKDLLVNGGYLEIVPDAFAQIRGRRSFKPVLVKQG